jgi:NAD+ synthetase
MKLALAQINPTVGDLEGNVNRILDAARSVREADLVVFPEMAIPGYPPRDILYDASFIDAVTSATRDLARRSRGLPPLLVGSFARSGRRLHQHPALHNIAYLVREGELTAAQIKQLLPVYDVFYEPRWFVPGEDTLPPIQIAGRRLGVLVCEDMWDEEYAVHPGGRLKKMGAEALVCLSASPYRRGGHAGRLHHASRQGLPLAFVNLVGGNDELIFDGGSFVLGGERLGKFEEQVRLVSMDGEQQAGGDEPRTAEAEEVFHALVLGLRDFARKNGLARAFIGLSGGVDSSVTAVIACRALGGENVTGIAIPSRFTDPRSTEAARTLSQALGMPFEIVELETLHRAAEQVLGPARSGGVPGENLQARLRMMVLMSFVNQHGGFLINTSNKSEMALGYSTLYGDLAGAISPLGDLTKPEVYELADWINRRGEAGGSIPAFAIDRKPSAELSAGQVDPFDYEAVSPQVEALVRANQSNPAMRASEHKRWQMGVVLKVSEKSFGRGRMMPITRR